MRENIAFGATGRDRREVEQAARLAQAHEFIDELPDGYDTVIGERGITLSGGQRQRIAIARALILDPRILILDDATASVDATTEAQIRLGLREVMKGRTTIIIAHRLSTIALADELVVLDDGRIAARGIHDELIGTSPVYREIYEHGLLEHELIEQVEASGRHEGLAAGLVHDARQRGAEVDDWSWKTTRPPRHDARRLTKPYKLRTVARAPLAARRRRRPLSRRRTSPAAIDHGIRDERPAARSRGRRRVPRAPASLELGSPATRRRTSPAGRASGSSPTCATCSSATCSGSRSASTSATAPASIISRLTNDVEAIDQLVTDGVTTLVQNTLTLVGAAVILFFLDWRLALATLAVIPFMVVATALFRVALARAYNAVRETLGDRHRRPSRRTSPACASSSRSRASAERSASFEGSTTTTGRRTSRRSC